MKRRSISTGHLCRMPLQYRKGKIALHQFRSGTCLALPVMSCSYELQHAPKRQKGEPSLAATKLLGSSWSPKESL